MDSWVRGFAACGAACLGSAAAAPPMGFVEAEPLSTSCSDLAQGVRVGVRNETARARKARVGLVLTGEDGRRVKARRVCGGLTRSPRKLTLRPGGVAVVTLRGATATAKGAFSGSLALFGRSGRVARRALTVSNEPAAAAGLSLTPLVASLSVDVEDTDEGPIWVPVAGSNAELPAVEKDEVEDRRLTVGALVGGPGGPVAVIYTGQSKRLTDDTAQVALRLDRRLEPGSYSGQVDLSPDAEGGNLTLAVESSTSFWEAVGWILLGIATGLVLLRIAGSLLPRARLLGRIADLTRRHQAAVASLEAEAPKKRWRKYRIGDLENLQKTLRKNVRETTGSWKVLIQIEKSVLEKNEALIDAAEVKVDLLSELPKHATPLEEALGLPRTQVPELSDLKGNRPVLDGKADELLAGDDLPIEELKPKLEEMDERAKQVGTLRELEGKLKEAWREVQKLPFSTDRGQAEGLLEETRRRLWKAGGDEDLEAGRALLAKGEEKAREARPRPSRGAVLGIVENRYSSGELIEEGDLENLQSQLDSLLAPSSEPEEDGGGTELPPIAAAAPTVPEVPAAREFTKEEASGAIWRAFGAQFLLVLLTLVLAVASGLGALWVGKPWGSDWDILAAIVWGATAQVVVTTLVSNLDGLGALASLRSR